MNFNLILLLLILSACGVKGDPIPPERSKLPSVLENYDDIQVDQPLKENKKR